MNCKRPPEYLACFPVYSANWRKPFITYDPVRGSQFGFSHWIEGVPKEFLDLALFVSGSLCKRMTTPYTIDKVAKMYTAMVAILETNGIEIEKDLLDLF